MLLMIFVTLAHDTGLRDLQLCVNSKKFQKSSRFALCSTSLSDLIGCVMSQRSLRENGRNNTRIVPAEHFERCFIITSYSFFLVSQVALSLCL